ncbi:cupin domain-containing protein [Faunimonas sp. B44]|uniref:cupin domain-containing protein n=1 Tax=Faunimonas sp. B44 TaxID=3461493 RepID=UPI004044E693
MRNAFGIFCLLVSGMAAANALAQQEGIAKPDLLLDQKVDGLPRDAVQSVRVMTASFRPGDRTVPHTHRFPVTVYVLEGAFTLEMKGHAPVTLRAGEAMVEPPHVEMTGFNRTDGETKVVIFYVSAPDTPFLDLLH